MPTTETREGDAIEELLAAVDEHDPDEVIIGAHRGTAGSSVVGSTARALLTELDRPAIVVPLPELD